MDLNDHKDTSQDKPKWKKVDGKAKHQSGGRKYARNGKNGHLKEIIMGLATNSALASIWNTDALKTNPGDGTANEWERTLIDDDRVPHFGSEQGELCHVENKILVPDRIDDPIKELAQPTDDAILIPGDAFTINDVVTLLVPLYKLEDHFRGILAIHINKRYEVALGIPKPAFNGSLIADVRAQRDNIYERIFLSQPTDRIERAVSGSVVKEQ